VLDRIGTIGLAVEDRLLAFRAGLRLAYAAAKGTILERGRGGRLVLRAIATQVYVAAIRPIAIYIVAALIFGALLIVQADKLLTPLALQHLIPSIVVVGVIREIAPLLVAVILVARTGSAIATEIGTMRVNRETDALSAMGMNLDYLVVLPRLIGLPIAACCLIVVFAVAAIVGAFALGAILDVQAVRVQLRELATDTAVPALGFALVKAFLFGYLIAAVGCEAGLSVSAADPDDVPRQTGRAVAHALLACFVVNAAISVVAVMT
jgi:phospholipid/cholesterol/gamma-HCH transport system permease protein